MALISTYDFEGQTPGANIANSGSWDVGSGTTPFTAESAAAVHGSIGGRISSATSYRAFGYNETSTTQTRVFDVYITPRVVSSNTYVMVLTDTGSTQRADVRINSAGTVSMRNVFSAVATSTVTLSMNTTYRFSWRISTSGQELRVYAGESATPLFTLTGALTSASHVRMAFGLVAASSGFSADYDTARIADDWLSPYEPWDAGAIFQWDSGYVPGTVDGTAPTVAGSNDVLVFDSSSTISSIFFTTPQTPQFTVRWYAEMPASWASASFSMFLSWAAGSFTSRINLSGTGSPGQYRLLRSGGVQVAASASNTLQTSTTYRFEYQVDGTNQTVRGAVFSLGSDTPLYDSGLISSTTTSTVSTRFYFGRGATGAAAPADLLDQRLSHIKGIGTVGAWIGRHASDVVTSTAPELLGIWNGSTVESAELLGVWDGTAIESLEVFDVSQ